MIVKPNIFNTDKIFFWKLSVLEGGIMQMKCILFALLVAIPCFAAEDSVLTDKDLYVLSDEKMMGKRFKGVATVLIARSQPLVYFNAPIIEESERNGRTAHLISRVPESDFAKIKIGTKLEIESMIVDQGYGALMMYVYTVRISD